MEIGKVVSPIRIIENTKMMLKMMMMMTMMITMMMEKVAENDQDDIL